MSLAADYHEDEVYILEFRHITRTLVPLSVVCTGYWKFIDFTFFSLKRVVFTVF